MFGHFPSLSSTALSKKSWPRTAPWLCNTAQGKVYANNVMALGCLAAMQDLGFNCPDEISLASIDNVPWSSVIKPKLTLVEQDQASLARVAINYLFDRMQNPEMLNAPGRETILTPRLVIGNSAKAPPQES